jgi:hypothetical protein
MSVDRSVEQEPVQQPVQLREWSPPRLERLDFDGTEKGSSSAEDSLAYASPPIS